MQATTKIRWGAVFAALLIVLIVALVVLRKDRLATTSSEEAYGYFLAGREAADKLYPTEAIANLENAVAADSSFAFAWALLANQYNVSGRFEEAKSSANTAYKLSSDLSRLERLLIRLSTTYLLFKSSEFDSTLNVLLTEYPEQTAPHFYKGNVLWRNGKIREAIEEYEKILRINPNHALAYNNLGYLYAELGDFDRAEEYLKKYAYIAPDQANPYDSLGEIYIVIGLYDRALEQFDRALTVRPELAAERNGLGCLIHMHKAKALIHKGLIGQARKALQKARELAPAQFYERDINLDRIAILVIQKQLKEAEAILNESSPPRRCDTYSCLRWAYFYDQIGQPEKIEELIEMNKKTVSKKLNEIFGDQYQTMDQIPTDIINQYPELQRLLNIYYFLRIRHLTAVGDYRGALSEIDQLQLTNVQVLMESNFEKARSLYNLDEYESALEALEPVLRINTNFSEVELLKAKVEIKLNSIDSAVNTLKRFISRTEDADPDWVPRQEALKLLEEIET